MTTNYTDDQGNDRTDRVFIGYEFDERIVASVNLACDGDNPRVVLDLGGFPIDLELVTGSVVAISGLIDALYEARTMLEEHQVQHATKTDTWTQEQVYVPNEWTEDQR